MVPSTTPSRRLSSGSSQTDNSQAIVGLEESLKEWEQKVADMVAKHKGELADEKARCASVLAASIALAYSPRCVPYSCVPSKHSRKRYLVPLRETARCKPSLGLRHFLGKSNADSSALESIVRIAPWHPVWILRLVHF